MLGRKTRKKARKVKEKGLTGGVSIEKTQEKNNQPELRQVQKTEGTSKAGGMRDFAGH